MDYKCTFCDVFFGDLNITIKHLKSEHNVKENQSQIKCVANHEIPCSRYFFSFSGLRAHVKTCVRNCENCLHDESNQFKVKNCDYN